MGKFPVNIEALSRFRSKAEQTKVLKKLDAGDVDILIGTHRILSKDIKFKDLGLIVVDEEQRFGVSAKENLRNSEPQLMYSLLPLHQSQERCSFLLWALGI